MTLLHTTQNDAPERAWLIATHMGDTPRAEVEDSLRELRALANTAQAVVIGETLCRLRAIHPATYIGRGKAAQIIEDATAAGADLIIFDDDLSPAQGRALEDIFKVRVVDRTQLILDIFAQRALTLEGRLQIELAQLRYLIPRLRGLWTHLERQQGGIGLKGPGEKQLELDRRRIEQRITRIKAQLQIVRQRRSELRRGRRRHGWALLTLVGYTNAGKSTLLNRLADANVHADDQLFATLDPTTRQILLPNHQPCLLTDTVGFIRKLPHHLVESFKATLEEVIEADLLLHVIDAADPERDELAEVVNGVLDEIGADGVSQLRVFNKIDLLRADDAERGGQPADGAPHDATPGLQRRSEPRIDRDGDGLPSAVWLSASTGDGLGGLLRAIGERLAGTRVRAELRLPPRAGRLRARLIELGAVKGERYDEDGWQLDIDAPRELLLPLAGDVRSDEGRLLKHWLGG